MVRHRADAAQALHHHRHFPVWPALDEFLEAAELDDVQAHLMTLFWSSSRMVTLPWPSTRDTGSIATRRRVSGCRSWVSFKGCKSWALKPAGKERAFRILSSAPWRLGGGAIPCNRSVVVHQAVAQFGSRPASRSVSTFQIASPEGGQPGMK